jgi:hypothetical protein
VRTGTGETRNRAAGLCEAGHGGRRSRRSAGRGGPWRGSPGGFSRPLPVAYSTLARLCALAERRPGLPLRRRCDRHPAGATYQQRPTVIPLHIANAAPKPGEHVVHVGAGVGYYTALFAELVAPSGVVTAIEFDQALALRAATNFSRFPNVRALHGDGALTPFDPADVVYIKCRPIRPRHGSIVSKRAAG